jgi:hypothetical protein
MKNKEEFIRSYNATGKGTSNKIPCTKCQTEITMFGSNLENRIRKFGSLECLLDTFTCRSCNSAARPKMVKVVVRREKKAKEEVVYDIPKFKVSVKREVFLKDAPDVVAHITSNNTCCAPNYYLDHARSCEGCAFYSHCQCALKAA